MLMDETKKMCDLEVLAETLTPKYQSSQEVIPLRASLSLAGYSLSYLDAYCRTTHLPKIVILLYLWIMVLIPVKLGGGGGVF